MTERFRVVFCLVVFCLCAPAASAAAAAAAGINITFITAGKTDELTLLAARYSNSTPGVNVRIRDVGWGGLLDEFASIRKTGLGTDGQPVDLTWMGSTWMGQTVVTRNLLTPLTPYLQKWSARKKGKVLETDFGRGTEYDYRYGNQWYGIPTMLDVRVFFYRKDLYRLALGHDRPPRTNEDVIANSEKIISFLKENPAVANATGVNISKPLSGWCVTTSKAGGLLTFVPFYTGFGASVADQNVPHKCAMTSPAFRSALEFYANLTWSGMNKIIDGTEWECQESFFLGTTFHALSHYWLYYLTLESGSFARTIDDLVKNVGMTLPPAGPVRASTFLGGVGVSMMKSSPHKEEAFRFLEYFLDPDSPEYYYFLGDDVSAYTSVLYSASGPRRTAVYEAMIANFPYAVSEGYPTVDFFEMGGIEDAGILPQLLYNVTYRVKTIDEATTEACALTNNIIDALWAEAHGCDGTTYFVDDNCTTLIDSRQNVTVVLSPTILKVFQGVGGSFEVICIIILVVIVWHREKPPIRLSSPLFNAIMVLGCMLGYLAAMIGWDETSGMCMAWFWIISLAFTILFGSLTVKMQRIHKIFSAKTPNMKNAGGLKDRALLRRLGLFIMFDLIVLTVWTATYPAEYHLETYTSGPVTYFATRCSAAKMNYFLGVLAVMKVSMLLITTYLAIRTRNVSLSDMNESKHIAICVCIIFLVVTLVIPALLVIGNSLQNKVAIAVLVNSSFIGTATMILGVLIGTKFYQMFLAPLRGDESVAAPSFVVHRGVLGRTASSSGFFSADAKSAANLASPEALAQEKAALEALRKKLDADRDALESDRAKLESDKLALQAEREALDRDRAAPRGEGRMPALLFLEEGDVVLDIENFDNNKKKGVTTQE